MAFISCKVTRDYSRPQFDIPTAFKVPDSVTRAADSAITDWAAFFQDSTLVTLLDSAIAHNFDLQDAMKHMAIADQYYKQAKAAYLPSINLNLLGITKEYRSKNYYSNPSSGWYDDRGKNPPKTLYLLQSQFTNSVDMQWELDIWGKIKRQKEEANAKYLETREAQKAVQTALISDVAQSYYLLQMLHEQLEIARTNLKLRSNTLKMIELQYKSGFVTALAVQQTKSQVLEASALIPQLEKEIGIQENGLRLLVGSLTLPMPQDSELSAVDPGNEVTDLPLYAVLNRPDVRASEFELIAANAEVGVTQAYRFPNISIDISGGVNSMLPENWFNIPGSLFGGIVGGITQPLLHQRKLKTDYEVAKLARDQSEIAFQKTVYTAITEIRNARISIHKIQEQLVIAQQQVDLAQKAVHSAAMLFRAGFATYLEVITAQGHELDSELELASLRADLLTARVQLYRALGGGWH
jgi:NodT family efflux transporter outer membrane factor (OMF) lipoprotein